MAGKYTLSDEVRQPEGHKLRGACKRYTFDEIIDRRGTSCIKYDFGPERKGRDDLLPLWVADMDFRLPREILDDIKKRVDHGIFGYTDPREDYFGAVKGWFAKRHGWEVKSEWITVTPGVVYAISTAIRAFTEKGDAVILQQPVYYPFSECIQDNGRRLINSQLVYENGRYRMDVEDFEKKVRENHVKLFLLCSPHNPTGRVWTQEELKEIGEICLRYGVIVFADEIHCDITYPGVRHVPFAGICPEFADIAVVGTSPSKTFNLAGLQVSNIVIPNEELRRRFRRENGAAGYSQANVLGMTACRAVYEKGGEWYEELLSYLKENLEYTREFFESRLPSIHLVEPEGTYLVWLDCSGLGLSGSGLRHMMVEEAHLWLDDGVIFGHETALFERINIACPRKTLEQAFSQLETAVKKTVKEAEV